MSQRLECVTVRIGVSMLELNIPKSVMSCHVRKDGGVAFPLFSLFTFTLLHVDSSWRGVLWHMIAYQEGKGIEVVHFSVRWFETSLLDFPLNFFSSILRQNICIDIDSSATMILNMTRNNYIQRATFHDRVTTIKMLRFGWHGIEMGLMRVRSVTSRSTLITELFGVFLAYNFYQ